MKKRITLAVVMVAAAFLAQNARAALNFVGNDSPVSSLGAAIGGTADGSSPLVILGLSDDFESQGLAYGVSPDISMPEPTTMIEGALLLLPFASAAFRQLGRKSQAAKAVRVL